MSINIDPTGHFKVDQLFVYLPDSFSNSFIEELFIDQSLFKITKKKEESTIVFNQDDHLANEEYVLDLKKDGVVISSSSNSGYHYALNSLSQLLRYTNGRIPICTIKDKPRFSYRGLHLDVSRHFFNVESIKNFLDFMAYYKFNKFHWHLTDDQGWRIEIKKYPKLQEIAAFRKGTLIGHYNDQPHQFDTIRYGGYYTQEEVKDIVNYAQERNIEVIPEIEMPGHASAAIAAYPFLGCENKAIEVVQLWGVFDDVFCPTEESFKFLENVLDEVIALFPSEYIHIGGDECPKTVWKNSSYCQDLIKRRKLKDEYGLQSYFIQRIEKYLNKKNKKIIGWDEILEGGLAPEATVMSWRGTLGGVEAALSNHDVIMSPTSFCYFDYYQSEQEDEPVAIGGYLPLKKVYHWDPIPTELPVEKHKYILGGQANTWTEYISSFSQVEYMTFTRGMAMSEVLWSSEKDYSNFIERFSIHEALWKSKGVNLANHILDLQPKVVAGLGQKLMMVFELPTTTTIEYTKPNAKTIFHSLHNESILLDESGEYTFQAKKEDKSGKTLIIDLNLHKGTLAKMSLDDPPHPKYPGNGPASIVNGIEGSNNKYGGLEWLGFKGDDCSINLMFEEAKEINKINFKFFKGEGQWIYLPRAIKIYTSSDGKSYELIKHEKNISSPVKICRVESAFENVATKFLRIEIENHGIIKEGLPGENHGSWLFVDEVVIR